MKSILALLVLVTTTLNRVVPTLSSALDMGDLQSLLVPPHGGNDDKDRRRGLSAIFAGSCLTDLLELDFAFSTLKPGFDDLTTGPLVFESIDAAGTLDLKVETVGPYVPANAAANNGFACAAASNQQDTGADNQGCTAAQMVQLNLQQGQSTVFRFSLLQAGTDTPAVVTQAVRFSVFDIDSGAMAGIETYTIQDWTNALFWNDESNAEASFVVTTSPTMTLVASATQTGRGCDNPTDPYNLNSFTCDNGTVDQRKRSFMVEFDAKNTWELQFNVSGSGTTGRNVLFAFGSELCDYCPASGGAACGGDPHFQRWNQDRRDSFHGECDLVLLHKSDFAGRRGVDLDVHIRTTIESKEDAWSYIESAAVKIGNDILEVAENGKLYLNGLAVQLKSTDEPLLFHDDDDYSVSLHSNDKGASSYIVNLAGGAVIRIKATGRFHTVTMDALPSAMMGSTGLLGKYGSGDMMGRDGQIMADFVSFGFEWQVQPDDPRLFRTSREPQLPFEQCRMPSQMYSAARRRRRLGDENTGLYEKAYAACSLNHPSNLDLCIDDVLLSGELALAEAW